MIIPIIPIYPIGADTFGAVDFTTTNVADLLPEERDWIMRQHGAPLEHIKDWRLHRMAVLIEETRKWGAFHHRHGTLSREIRDFWA